MAKSESIHHTSLQCTSSCSEGIKSKVRLCFIYFLILLSEPFSLIISSFFSQSDVSDLAILMATPHARYQSAWTRSDIQVEVTSQCLSCDGARASIKIKESLKCAIVTYYGELRQHP